jgi:mannose-6-phosphate isomerase-like protein (cupin superfamily)
VWHSHADEDELFLVLKGKLTIELRDGAVTLGPGQMVVVPRGIDHRPVADGEVHVLLFEPAGTLNTGSVRNERTVEEPKRV